MSKTSHPFDPVTHPPRAKDPSCATEHPKPKREIVRLPDGALYDTYYRFSRPGQYAHCCDVQDGWLIDESDPEFVNCTCYPAEEVEAAAHYRWSDKGDTLVRKEGEA